MEDIANIVVQFMKDLGKMLIQLPFKIWSALPSFVHYTIYLLTFALIIFILVYIIRNREDILNQLY